MTECETFDTLDTSFEGDTYNQAQTARGYTARGNTSSGSDDRAPPPRGDHNTSLAISSFSDGDFTATDRPSSSKDRKKTSAKPSKTDGSALRRMEDLVASLQREREQMLRELKQSEETISKNTETQATLQERLRKAQSAFKTLRELNRKQAQRSPGQDSEDPLALRSQLDRVSRQVRDLTDERDALRTTLQTMNPSRAPSTMGGSTIGSVLGSNMGSFRSEALRTPSENRMADAGGGVRSSSISPGGIPLSSESPERPGPLSPGDNGVFALEKKVAQLMRQNAKLQKAVRFMGRRVASQKNRRREMEKALQVPNRTDVRRRSRASSIDSRTELPTAALESATLPGTRPTTPQPPQGRGPAASREDDTTYCNVATNRTMETQTLVTISSKTDRADPRRSDARDAARNPREDAPRDDRPRSRSRSRSRNLSPAQSEPRSSHRGGDRGSKDKASRGNNEASRAKERSRERTASAEEDAEEDEDEEDDEDDEEESSSSSSSLGPFPQEENMIMLNDKYVFRKRIHLGDNTAVYKASPREDLNKVIIVKVIDDDDYTDEKPPKEVRMLQRLVKHPCIVTLLDWFPLKKTKCYALVIPFVNAEKVDGSNSEKTRKYMWDLLHALHYCHQCSIIYRDVKPENIMFDVAKQRAILIDYDCATIYDPNYPPVSLAGTKGYFAPEIASKARRAQGYDFSVDVYSAGVVFYEMLFHVKRRGHCTHKQMQRDLANLKDITPAHELLMQMLERDPLKRIACSRALKQPYFAPLRNDNQRRTKKRTTRGDDEESGSGCKVS